jgi:hypothetical protein
VGRALAEIRKLLRECLTLAGEELSRTDRYIAREVRRLRLRMYAAKVSADPENSKRVAEARELAARGIPDDQLLGRDELAKLKQATKPRGLGQWRTAGGSLLLTSKGPCRNGRRVTGGPTTN